MRGTDFFRMIATEAPLRHLPPHWAEFFAGYLEHEKVVPFGSRWVVNTHLPPYPSPAFTRAVEHLRHNAEGDGGPRLLSVTWGVTNRCSMRCWHCYNAGRSERDLPTEAMAKVARQLQAMGAATVTLTGGEPLLRDDLAEIIGAFDERSSLVLGTTGDGLTPERARGFAEHGLFAVGVSLDSVNEAEHDALRGKTGAFRAALAGLGAAATAGLYPYVVTVATHDLLVGDRLLELLRFAKQAGALEVHLLQPSATGRLAGRSDVLLRGPERERLFDLQRVVAQDDDLPILSSLVYLESPDAFGCGAGLTHLYLDGSGEVCPCNWVPLSFGNVSDEPLAVIAGRMGEHFCRPRCACTGTLISRALDPTEPVPTPLGRSREICARHLPREHGLPRFARLGPGRTVGEVELAAAYDRVHADYDDFWVVEAGRPVDELIDRLPLAGTERVFEAGSGTGYATARLASRLTPQGRIVGVDLSAGMLEQATRRLRSTAGPQVRLCVGDALLELQQLGPGQVDVVFSSWVLGYILLRPFFAAAARALAPGGRLAFVVHRQDSPRQAMEVFAELVARDPGVLDKQVLFDFPRDAHHCRELLEPAGFEPERLEEGEVTFRYGTAEQVLEHLLKSGAGTAFHDAVAPEHRDALSARFCERLAELNPHGGLTVIHDYVACVARLGLPAPS